MHYLFLFGCLVAFGYHKQKGVLINYLEKFKLYPLTYTLIVINTLLFVVASLNESLDEALYLSGVLHGYSVVMKGEVYRLVTSIFLHSDSIHLIMNMLSLYMVGTVVERLFNKFEYLSIYFISAFFGSFTSIYVHLGGQAVGASGAIFGLFGALAGFAFVHRNTMREQFIDFMKNFGVILFINLVIGFTVPNIDVSAHVGGLVAGVIGGYLIAKQKRYLWIYIAISGVSFVLIYNYISTLYAH